jgi:uncharacterized protein YvpB
MQLTITAFDLGMLNSYVKEINNNTINISQIGNLYSNGHPTKDSNPSKKELENSPFARLGKTYGEVLEENYNYIKLNNAIISDKLTTEIQCSYCGINKERFGINNKTYCVKAPCPKDAVIIDTKYYNQCELQSPAGCQNLCMNGCGATSTKMLLDNLNTFKTEISEIQCSSGSLYSKDSNGDFVAAKLYSKLSKNDEYNIHFDNTYYPYKIDSFFEETINQINLGNPVMFSQKNKGATCNTQATKKDPERCYCSGGHVMVIVGYYKDYFIVNDPYTGSKETTCKREIGHNLILSRANLKEAIKERPGTYMITINKQEAKASIS